MKTIYKVEDLSKEYDGKEVLKVEDFDLFQGEIFGLVGPSGAGKSTLLRLLDFLEPPTSGVIKFKGQEYHQTKEPGLDIKRKITTVFQEPALLKTTVWKNITYPLKIRGIPIKGELKSELENLITDLSLWELKDQRADKLSGGEAQRVAVARALIFKPEVLFLDEPTSNLDPTNISIIENKIKQYGKRTGKTVLVVTHNIFQAKRLTDRVGLLHRGEFIEIKERDNFFNSPDNKLTQKFLAGDLLP